MNQPNLAISKKTSKLKMALGTKKFLKLLRKITPGSCSVHRYYGVYFGKLLNKESLQNPPKKRSLNKKKFHREKK